MRKRRTTVAGTLLATALLSLGLTPVTSAQADVTLDPILRINSGATVDTTVNGVTWSKDTHFVGGQVSTRGRVVGTDAELHRVARYNLKGYEIPVATGTYEVQIHMNEPYVGKAGDRVFNVTAESAPVLTNFDIFAAAGGKNKTYTHTFTTDVTDGSLSLGYQNVVDNAIVSGLTISPVDTTLQAPQLTDPYVWYPTETNKVLKGMGDRDVLIKWPDRPLDTRSGFQINGGGDIVSLGGIIKPSQEYLNATVGSNDNRCLYIGGHGVDKPKRTIHIEGLHCAGDFIWEGINIDSKAEDNLVVQFENTTIDRVRVNLPGGLGNHYGGDALQTWNGPHELHLENFEAKKLHYQGLFLQPYAFGGDNIGSWSFENVTLTGAPEGSSYLLWLAGNRTDFPLAIKDLTVTPGGTKTLDKTVWNLSQWPEVNAAS